jgi:hypothetical protein
VSRVYRDRGVGVSVLAMTMLICGAAGCRGVSSIWAAQVSASNSYRPWVPDAAAAALAPMCGAAVVGGMSATPLTVAPVQELSFCGLAVSR